MCDSIDDEICVNSWLSLADILWQPKGTDKPKVAVALLKRIIAAEGIRTRVEHGIIMATYGDEKAITSEAYIYKLLDIYEAELRGLEYLPSGQLPDRDPYRWLEYGSPLNKFGWPKEEAPDFAAWIAKSLQKSKELSSTTTKDANLSKLEVEGQKDNETPAQNPSVLSASPQPQSELLPAASAEKAKPLPITQPELWFVKDEKDPEPVQPWYTPARYFARKLVEGDPTLLTKRDTVVNKVVQSLTAAGIKKRGGKKPFNPDTIKKALSNVSLG